jgi:hypothetical protein
VIGVPHNASTAEWPLHINLAKACTFMLFDSKNIRPSSTPPVKVQMRAGMAEVEAALRRAPSAVVAQGAVRNEGSIGQHVADQMFS